MTDRSAALAVRGPEIAHETIDGETVIVDLHSGAYYSLRGGAATAWQWAVGGASIEAIATAAPSLEQTVHELVDAQLLVPTRDRGTPVAVGDEVIDEPVVEAFRDLEELLQLDPIHDVDAAGWPRPAEA